ncbi:unnamed protein product [Linum trigynum]
MATKLLAVYAAFLTIGLRPTTSARELRPSYHGLGYYHQQQSTTSPFVRQRPSPEMKSFFNVPPSLKSSSSPSSSVASPSVGLPRAMNTSDEAWWRSVSGWKSEDRVRKALLIGSVACGVAGVVLLVASIAVYLVKRRALRRSSAAALMGSSAAPSTTNSTPNNNINVSTLAIVPKLTTDQK